MGSASFSLVASALVLSASTAAAQPAAPTEYMVTLKTGAIYRGEVLEYEPKDHVTLRLINGRLKQFDWSEIASSGPVNGAALAKPAESSTPLVRTERSGAESLAPSKISQAPAEAPPPPPAVRAEPPAPTPRRRSMAEARPGFGLASASGEVANLRVKSPDRTVRVEFLKDSMEVSGFVWGFETGFVVDGVGEIWRPMCEYPCNRPVARRATYRVVGDEIMNSESFTLPSKGADFLLHVSPGRRSARVGAWVSLALGGLFASIGAIVLSTRTGAANEELNMPAVYGGAAMVGVGALGMLGSIPLFLTSRTTLEIERRDRPAPTVPAKIDDEGATQPTFD